MSPVLDSHDRAALRAGRQPAGARVGFASIDTGLPLAGAQLLDADASTRTAPLRPVRADDAEAMQRFVMGLSAASRRLRFHGAINACTPALLRQLTQADGVRHVALVACMEGDAGEQIVGEARYVVVTETGSARAEFAIAVADRHQGRGLADRLLRALLQAAARGGVATLYGDVLGTNARMAAFLRRHGFAVDPWADVDAGSVRWQRTLPRQAPVAASIDAARSRPGASREPLAACA